MPRRNEDPVYELRLFISGRTLGDLAAKWEALADDMTAQAQAYRECAGAIRALLNAAKPPTSSP